MMNVDLVIKKFRYLSQDIKSTVIGHAVEKYLTGDLKKKQEPSERLFFIEYGSGPVG